MNRNRRGFRDRDGGRRGFGGHDGLLGEGPSGGAGGGMFDPIMNNHMNQLMLAQQLLQKQAMLSGGFGAGGDLGALAGAMNNMQMMQQQQQLQHAMGGFGGGQRGGSGGMDQHRKRVGVQQDRDMDSKRRRRDSFGRSGDHDRFHGRDDNRGGDGRDRVRSSRWEPANDRQKHQAKKGNDDYDPAEPTEDEEGRNKDLYCHVCKVSVYDDASFQRHLNGTKHQARMNSVLTVHQMKSNQLQSRLKAEEHLRKIEGKTAGFDPDYFCKICNNDLTIPWERHRFSNIHKQRQLQVKRGCGWCDVHNFNNFTEVLEHRETEEHKKNAEVYGKKRDGTATRDGKTEKPRSGSATDKSKVKKKEEEEEDLTIPEFNAENPVGQNYIIPVTGFFCKLCNKFYNNEKSAKGPHCQSEGHYEKFKAATEAKIEAREKKKAEEAAAAEAAAAEDQAEGGEDEEMTEEDKEGEEADKDTAEVKEENQEYEEDYDDELPLEDSDDEGGLVKCIANSGVEDNDENKQEQNSTTLTAGDSLLNETSANGSFTYLSGEKAQAHIDQQTAASTGQVEIAAKSADDGEDTDVEDNVEGAQEKIIVNLGSETAPATVASSMKMEGVDVEMGQEDTGVKGGADDTFDDLNDISGEGSGLSQEEVQATSTPVTDDPITTKPTKGRGTARRGRGRGRAKAK
ncbi:Cdkn1a interacting Zinc finger protein 1a [Plakobranchus ocellatus]|uniref:Cdkn1a interacting Zinc finger protein 1a n=1 Tax=Plakobranchus ocellatus TaxID=259542 RepID=A0AAV4DN10_9GAST|nr:Cdkn1a interacting Zinc finger protein 1a [Plakobranchus ocellatus]